MTDIGIIENLFAEELGLVLEVSESNKEEVCRMYAAENISCSVIGESIKDDRQVCL